MKKYLESFLNTETGETSQVEIHEYGYDDWWKGTIWSSQMPGKYLQKNLITKEIHFDYLPHEEWEKILKKRKEVYYQKARN